jgi:hypothetical protein
VKCQECGEGPFAAVHARRTKYWEHDYASPNYANRVYDRTTRAWIKKPAEKLCRSCSEGKHAGTKTEIGCIETVAALPFDFICGCLPCAEHLFESGASFRGRSDAEGVVRCRL